MDAAKLDACVAKMDSLTKRIGARVDAAGQRFIAFQMWKIGDKNRDAAWDLLRKVQMISGFESAEVVYEARDFAHSSSTHTGVRLIGNGAKFKKAAEAAGFRVSTY